MSKSLCLIVDDEPDILELLAMTLKRMGIECCTAENLTQAKKHLHINSFDLCLTDMRLPDGNGIELVDYIARNYPDMPVAMITAHGNVKTAIQALKTGAFDFIAKPVNVQQLRNLVNMALQLPKQCEPASSSHRVDETLLSTSQPGKRHDKVFSNLIGQSEAMQTVRAKIKKLARSQAPVYIRGESGTGKEVVARAIHALSACANRPFVPVNCGAIPSELMETEFFGYKKGSFTGAHIDKTGLFQAAQGGTLFLDEVAELPLPMQVKLLRAIQEKQIRPLGVAKEIPVEVRILSATHHDLAKLVKQGRFRQDLFYRINVIELYIPPLRERTEDLRALVKNILDRFITSGEYQSPRLSDEAMVALEKYTFPGNVRELENILERAMTLCENNLIKPEDLQLPEYEITPFEEVTTAAQLDPLLEDVEKETILNALEQTNGNKTKAAKLLGIGFGALRYRLQKFNVETK